MRKERKTIFVDGIECFGVLVLWIILVTACCSVLFAFIDMLGIYAASHGQYPGSIATTIREALPGKKILVVYLYPVLTIPMLFWASRKARR
jgi:hypothetical protein